MNRSHQQIQRSGFPPAGDDRRSWRYRLPSHSMAPPVLSMLATERTVKGKALSPGISIGTDDTITIMSPATEMGQGSMTSLPLIIAEELDADWNKVRIVPAPAIDAIYGNPGFFGADVHGGD